MGVDLASGKKTDHGEPSGPRATSAVSPWLFSRQSRPATRRKEDKCARNSRAQRRPVRVSSDIIAAVFPHSGGAETNGGGNSWATMLPSRSRSRRVERRKNRSWRTNAAASHVGGVALFRFPPALTARAENFRTSERSAAFGESSPMRSRRRFSIQTGQRPRAAKKLGDDAVLKQSAPLLLCRSRPQRVWGRQASERTLRGGGISAASRLRFPPQIYRRRGAKSDVRQPIKRSRRSCGVAVATYEDTNRSGRKICTMRYLGRDAMDNSPPELTGRRSKNRSWRTKWAARQVGSVALVIHPAESTDHTE